MKSRQKNKKLQFRGYLIVGLVITFLFVGDITYAYAQGESPATISSQQHELREIKSHPPIQLDFRLVGTIIAGEENSYAVIMDETSGKQSMYKLGESINEAKVLKIDKDSIIVEIEKRIFILRITGGNYTAGGSPAIGASEELPYFEPVFSETGPPVDENVLVEELPHFEPVFSETGPPVEEKVAVEELPHFEPVINSTGPEVEPEGVYEDLSEFESFESDSGPPGM